MKYIIEKESDNMKRENEMIYYVTYWLPSQSRLSSRPQMIIANSVNELFETISKIKECGYEFENIIVRRV